MALGAALVLALALAGCSAPDRVGLTTDAAGRASVLNCGTWISAVRVVDPETGRVEWSATASGGAEGRYGQRVAEVRLGQEPQGWESTGVAPEPGRPQRILVESGIEGVTVLDVPALPADAVYYDGQLRSGRFAEVCRLFHPHQRWVRAAGWVGLFFFVALLIGAAVGVVWLVRHNRPTAVATVRRRPAPPPPPPPAPPDRR